MLREILTQVEINEIAVKNTQALMNFSEISNKSNLKKKHIFISAMRKAGFTLKESKYFKFKMSFDLWVSCKNSQERNKGGRPVIKKLTLDKINNFMHENSCVAANRYLKLQSKNARYSNGSMIFLYKNFIKESKQEVSMSSFRKTIRTIYKKPHRYKLLNFNLIYLGVTTNKGE